MQKKLRNIAIIAHVDHGKTTLVDKLLQQSGTLKQRSQVGERILDSNDLEKERGITILAKNTAIEWHGYHINIVDTPGHADFGGEVERILSMVDSVLLLVDAVDGPMPQTRFVTQKAFANGLNPIVVINKVDRPEARPEWVINQVFDLFDSLGATDQQLDFPVIYTSATEGYATTDLSKPTNDMTQLLEMIVESVAPPIVNIDAPFQMQISSLDYSSYVGTIGIGRIKSGTAKKNMDVVIVDRNGNKKRGRVLQVLEHLGLKRHEAPEAYAGDIIAIVGIAELKISDTLCDPEHVSPLPALTVDEPTVVMNFQPEYRGDDSFDNKYPVNVYSAYLQYFNTPIPFFPLNFIMRDDGNARFIGDIKPDESIEGKIGEQLTYHSTPVDSLIVYEPLLDVSDINLLRFQRIALYGKNQNIVGSGQNGLVTIADVFSIIGNKAGALIIDSEGTGHSISLSRGDWGQAHFVNSFATYASADLETPKIMLVIDPGVNVKLFP